MSLISRIQALMLSDDSDDSARLVALYQKHSEEHTGATEAIDDALICLCGYSLATLLKWCECEKCGHDCAPDYLDEPVEAEFLVQGQRAGKCPECGGDSYVMSAEDE